MSQKTNQPSEHPKPVGTMALLLLYVLLIVLLWGNVYLTMLERGVTR
jgi:hypothetical protein